VEITTDEKHNIRVKSVSGGKNVKVDMKGIAADSFPEIAKVSDATSVEIPERELREGLSKVVHAMAVASENPAFCGVKIALQNNEMTLVGTDGFRVAIKKYSLPCEDHEMIIPEKAVTELIRGLSSAEDSKIKINIDRNQVLFTKENYAVFCKLLEGRFIDFRKMETFDTLYELSVDRDELLAALERALVIAVDKVKTPILCYLSGQGADSYMRLENKSNIAAFEEELGANITKNPSPDKEYSIGFNPRFLADSLKSAGTERVTLGFNEDTKPFRILPEDKPGEEQNLFFVIVPMRK